MWGIQVGRVDTTPVVKGFLDGDNDDDDITEATEALTTLAGDWSDSESDEDDDAEDFAVKNAPRPPPAELMYGGQGKCETPTCAIKCPMPANQSPRRSGRDKAREVDQHTSSGGHRELTVVL